MWVPTVLDAGIRTCIFGFYSGRLATRLQRWTYCVEEQLGCWLRGGSLFTGVYLLILSFLECLLDRSCCVYHGLGEGAPLSVKKAMCFPKAQPILIPFCQLVTEIMCLFPQGLCYSLQSFFHKSSPLQQIRFILQQETTWWPSSRRWQTSEDDFGAEGGCSFILVTHQELHSDE